MYKVTASEERNEKATEFETKSMLYMMNYYSDSDKIHYFAIDFFNDVTGIDRMSTSCFDMQSKGIKDITPYALGQYLVTLFKNFISEFNFEKFILFVQGVSKKLREELNDKDVFDIRDLSFKCKEDIEKGLKSAANDKTYIEDKSKITDENLESFLDRVVFVIDSHTKEEYIKDTVQFKSSLIINDVDLRKIFKEIRDKQSSKKNNNVEGELIQSIGCVLQYDKCLSKDEIQQLIINRICFKTAIREMRNHYIPPSFLSCLSNIDELIRDEIIEDCQNDIFRLLYDKNNKEAFWDLFEEIVIKIKNNPMKNIDQIYDLIDKDKVCRVNFLDVLSTKYYISLIKERIR